MQGSHVSSIGLGVCRSSGRSEVSSFISGIIGSRCVSCEVQAFWIHSGTNNKAKSSVSFSGWLGRYTNVKYLQSLPDETRTITVPCLSGS